MFQLFDGVHGAGGGVAAIPVGVEMSQRAVVRRECVLVDADERDAQYPRPSSEAACGIFADIVQEIAHSSVSGRLGDQYTLPCILMTWTSGDILNTLFIVVAVMLVVALYHLIFVLVDARKISRRVERLTKEVETVVLKPLSMTDKAFEWMIEFFESKAGKKK